MSSSRSSEAGAFSCSSSSSSSSLQENGRVVKKDKTGEYQIPETHISSEASSSSSSCSSEAGVFS